MDTHTPNYKKKRNGLVKKYKQKKLDLAYSLYSSGRILRTPCGPVATEM